MDLADALELGDRELVAFVGAGGKKTAMAHLLKWAVERGLRPGYTTTTHMPPPTDVPLVVGEKGSVERAFRSTNSPIAFARDRVKEPARVDQKVRGHNSGTIEALFESGPFDWLLVKADGARRREFKAPGPDEPVIPSTSTQVVPVASVRAVGQPLDEETVHRPERVASITGLDQGNEITPDAVGTVLASNDGGRKSVPSGASVTPLVNKADTQALRATAREVIHTALDQTEQFERGVVSSFEQDVFELVERTDTRP